MFKKFAISAFLLLLLAVVLLITAAVFYNIGSSHGFQTGYEMVNPKEITLVGRSATNTLTDVDNVLVALRGDRYLSIYVGNAFTDDSVSITIRTPLSRAENSRKLRAVPTAGGALLVFDSAVETEQQESKPTGKTLSPASESTK